MSVVVGLLRRAEELGDAEEVSLREARFDTVRDAWREVCVEREIWCLFVQELRESCNMSSCYLSLRGPGYILTIRLSLLPAVNWASVSGN